MGDCAGLRVYKVMVNVDGGDGLCRLDHIKLRIGLADLNRWHRPGVRDCLNFELWFQCCWHCDRQLCLVTACCRSTTIQDHHHISVLLVHTVRDASILTTQHILPMRPIRHSIINEQAQHKFNSRVLPIRQILRHILPNPSKPAHPLLRRTPIRPLMPDSPRRPLVTTMRLRRQSQRLRPPQRRQ